MKRYYSLVQNGTTADIDIYGDICEWAWEEYGEMSSVNLSKKLAELEGVDTINVNINSYGGSVKEGLAIHNALKRHNAKIVTRCDGFACSIASVIFMAGDERIMYDSSLLMIHNAWTSVWGANAAELRKQAEDLDTITQTSKNAYMAYINISEEELSELMDAESWIPAQDAVDMGFATSVERFEADNVSQNARMRLFEMVTRQEADAEAGAAGAAPAGEEHANGAEQAADPDPDEPGDVDDPDGEDPDDEPEDKCGDDEDKDKQQVSASFFSMAFK